MHCAISVVILKGFFFKDKTGLKIFVFINATILTFVSFVKIPHGENVSKF